jgi:quinol-cytochrome oxidoreductase complex cytochrome b subunit
MQFALRYPDLTKRWSRGQGLAGIAFNALNLLWSSGRFNRHMLTLIARYAVSVTVPYFRPTSVFGFSLIIGMYAQMYSGFLLAIFYLPDPSFVIPTREDLFMEVWWFGYVYKAHVLGVDILFTLSYLHILKKFYIKNYTEGDLDGWFTGAYAFLVYHLVVFLGITLSTNHLGDVTIMIAANIFWSLFLRWHKVYAPFFSNKHLSTEQLTRFMVAHYISAWYYLYLVQTHVMFIHEMWDADSNRSTQLNTSTPKASWGWDALKKEVMSMFVLYKGIALLYFLMAHPDAKVVNYAFFEQWSEAEMEEINFFIVAPHWYFRAHMGLLTVCAHHYEGLAWFVAFYILLCYTPHLYRFWNKNPRPTGAKADSVPTRHSLLQELAYVGLFSSMLYVGGTLPCGRFYYENIEGFFGNSFLRLSYEYIYIYLGFLAHTIDAFERWYLASPVHKLFLGRLVVVLQVYTAKNSPAQLVKFLLSKLPRISLDPRDWYRYLLTQRDVWGERVQGWVRYFNSPQV